MKKIYFFILLIFASNFIWAQKAIFQVIDAESHKDIDGVIIHSRLEKNQDNHLKTDFLGKIALFVALEDTISFDHKGYFPIHLIVTHLENYDFKHPIRVYLTPIGSSFQRKDIKNFNNLDTFEYHLIHDKVADNQNFKIRILEDKQATQKRQNWLGTTRDKYEAGFNIVDIKLSENKKKF